MYERKLINVANQMEADMLVELLKNNEINAMAKTSGSGGYLQVAMGTNMFGVDIYVDEEQYEEAKKISDEFFDEHAEYISDAPEDEREDPDNDGKKEKDKKDKDTNIPLSTIGKLLVVAAIVIMIIMLRFGLK